MLAGSSEALFSAVRLGLQYNPLVSVLATPVVAALAVRSPKKHSLLGLPGALLLLAWLVGDGTSVAALALAPANTLADAPALAVWALVGLGVGYVLPVWAGAFVGRRVTHGTGWLSAVAVAATLALALAAIMGVVAG